MDEIQIKAFLIGLGLGLIGIIAVYIREQFKRSTLNRQIRDLKSHLYQKMEIESEAMDRRKQEVEQLKAENENLRVSMQSLAQKPGRREVMNLHVYQQALSQMSELVPGFAAMWQKSLREAERAMQEMEEGKKPFIKRIIPLDFFGGSNRAIERSNSDDDDDKG